jgi:hypothetical protein
MRWGRLWQVCGIVVVGGVFWGWVCACVRSDPLAQSASMSVCPGSGPGGGLVGTRSFCNETDIGIIHAASRN